MGYNRGASRAIDDHAGAGPCAGGCGGTGTYVVPAPADGLTLTDLQNGRAGDDLPGVLARSTRWCEGCRPKRGRRRADRAGRTLPVAAQDDVQAALTGRSCCECGQPATRARIPGAASLGAVAYGVAANLRQALMEDARWYCAPCLAVTTGRAGQQAQAARAPRPAASGRAARAGVRWATIDKYGLTRERLEQAQERCTGISQLVRELFGPDAKGGSKNATVRAYAAIVAAEHPDYVPPAYLS